jgi:hypothetical protein
MLADLARQFRQLAGENVVGHDALSANYLDAGARGGALLRTFANMTAPCSVNT